MPGGVRGTMATGSILTPFMIEGKKTRQRLKSEPKGLSERDIQIYELHKVEKTARKLSEQFGLSESGIRGICWVVKKTNDMLGLFADRLWYDKYNGRLL